jgi:aminoglycoside phosphotransferase (APT) family kinase protein
MTPQTSPPPDNYPSWLPLLKKPYDQLFSGKSAWDLRDPDGRPMHIERGGPGLNNCIFRVRLNGDLFSCKLFVADERQRAYREWAALQALHAAGLALAPAPVAYAPAGPLPQPVVVYRWVEGAPLGGGTMTDDELARLVTSLSLMHRTPPAPAVAMLTAWHQPASYAAYLDEIRSFVGRVRDWANGPRAAANDLPGWIADLPARMPLLEETLEQAEVLAAGKNGASAYPVPALVRVDGNLDNVLHDASGALYFVDWEYSGLGDPAYDLAELRWHPRNRGVSQGQWEAALAAYRPHPADTTFQARLAVYSRLLPAWWVGRSAIHLLQGAGQLGGSKRLVAVPERLYRSVRAQLDGYLAALGLIEAPVVESREEE